MSQAKLAFVEKQYGHVPSNQKQSRKGGSKTFSVEAALFEEFFILVATCTVVAGTPVLKRGLQVWLDASFDEKQLFAAPLLSEPPAPLGLQDVRVNTVPQGAATISHRG